MSPSRMLVHMTAAASALIWSAVSAPQVSAQLKDDETIVFLGDSITQAGDAEGGYVDLFRKAIQLRRPDSGIKVIGAGISGNRVPDIQKRLDKDVLSHHPNIVVIYIGINDVWHSLNGKGTSTADYEAGLRDVIGRCQTAGARVIVATPSVIGEKTDGTNKLDAMLEEYSEISRRVAAATGASVVDLRKSFLSQLKEYNLAGESSGVLTSDEVHLNAEGNRFVAVRMLEAVGEVPARSRVLRHIVLFRFRPEVTPKQIDEINMAFHQLKNQIPAIQDFERGVNNSPEKLDQGFTHGYVVTFATEEDRAAYLPNSDHWKFVEMIDGKIEKALVFDYWAVE
ncbi:MAG: GDSL-type esterase/lipase family protein [Planctomyces sp.]